MSPAVTDWDKEIRKVSRKASFDWPGIVEQEDMVQDIYVHILERPGTLEDLAEMDDNSRYQTLHKIAQRIASQERVSYEHFSGQFRYSVGEVRDSLTSGALGALGRIVLANSGSRLQASWSAEDYVSDGADHSDTVIDMVSMEQDLANGLEAVRRNNLRYYELIIRKFLRREVFPTGSADSKALQRAVEILTTKMNHAHKAPGGRPYNPDEEVCIQPVKGWDTYYAAGEDRAEYDEGLSEIHEPVPELTQTHADGLGTFNIKKGSR